MSKRSTKNQIISTLCGNLVALGYGTAIGWASPSMPILQSEMSPLASGPLTLDEGSWITALLCIGGFAGNIFYGLIAGYYGRKIPLLTLAIPQIISWFLIIFGPYPFYLYISRFCGGFAGAGAFVLIPLFIAEISDDKIRGFLGSLLVLSCNLGILLGFVLGSYFSYLVTSAILLSLPLLFIISFIMFPETPQSLLKNGYDEIAEKSLSFYRNIPRNSTPEEFQLIKTELAMLKDLYRPEKEITTSNRLTLNNFKQKSARKAFLIGIALVSLNQLNGIFAMLSYTATIFAHAGSALSPNISAVIIGVIQVIGGYLSTNLVEIAGRKILIGTSAFGIGVGQLVLGAYTLYVSLGYNTETFRWVPIVAFSSTIFVANLGVLNLPFMVIAEVMPEKIRSVGATICMGFLWFYAFAMVKFFPIASATYGMHTCFFVFGVFSFAGALFVFFVMPETKGKSYKEILHILER